MVELRFEPQMVFLNGRFLYGKGVYANAGNMILLAGSKHLYRAYVFDSVMWNQLSGIGIVPSSLYRGEDKKW